MFLDNLADSGEFLRADSFRFEQARYQKGRVTGENTLEEVAKHPVRDSLFVHSRLVDIGATLDGVGEIPLLFEDAKHRADGRFLNLASAAQGFQDGVGCGFSLCPDELHNFEFSWGEGSV